MQTLALSGHLTAVQPIAVSPPDSKLWNDDPKKSPARLPRAGRFPSAPRYIPSSTLRHIIRHGITAVVAQHLLNAGKRLDLDPVLALSRGFIRTKKKSGDGGSENAKGASARILAERTIRERNPIFAMLGAWGVPSELRVGNAIPDLSRGVEDFYAETPGVVRKAIEEDVAAALSDDDMSLYCARLDEWSLKDKKDVGLKHLGPGWEEIVAGTQCSWDVKIHRHTALKTGSVLAALRHFANDPAIGAHRALGRGEVAIELDARLVTQDLLRGPTSVPAGTVKVSAHAFTVDGLLAEYLAAFDEVAQAGFPGLEFREIPVSAADEEG